MGAGNSGRLHDGRCKWPPFSSFLPVNAGDGAENAGGCAFGAAGPGQGPLGSLGSLGLLDWGAGASGQWPVASSRWPVADTRRLGDLLTWRSGTQGPGGLRAGGLRAGGLRALRACGLAGLAGLAGFAGLAALRVLRALRALRPCGPCGPCGLGALRAWGLAGFGGFGAWGLGGLGAWGLWGRRCLPLRGKVRVAPLPALCRSSFPASFSSHHFFHHLFSSYFLCCGHTIIPSMLETRRNVPGRSSEGGDFALAARGGGSQ